MTIKQLVKILSRYPDDSKLKITYRPPLTANRIKLDVTGAAKDPFFEDVVVIFFKGSLEGDRQ